MEYRKKKNIAKKLIRGSVVINIGNQVFADVVAKVQEMLNAFYLKTVEWKPNNPHTAIRIQETTSLHPMIVTDMPMCSEPSRAIIVSSDMDPLSSMNVVEWKKNFEETAKVLGEGFDQNELHVAYIDIDVTTYEKA